MPHEPKSTALQANADAEDLPATPPDAVLARCPRDASDVDWASIVADPRTHPYYPEYQSLSAAAKIPADFVERSWDLIIKGLQRQDELRAAGAMNTPVPEFVALGKLVSANNEFLMLPPNAKAELALWMGGIQVSEHARRSGYETLESTRLGGVLDKLTNPKYKLWLGDKTWGPQGGLWNTISAEYVKVAASKHETMHVFMRTHDLDSIFYREELVNWQKAKGKSKEEVDGMTYHVLVGMDSFEHERVFDNEKEAKAYLLTFLGQTQRKFQENMLEKGANHRYRSEVWRDNERAYRGTFDKKDYASYKEYIEHPLPGTVKSFVEAEKATSPDSSFDPKRFSSVMDELLTKVGRKEG